MRSSKKEDHIRYEAATGRMLSPPWQFFIELTGQCNLACVHCPVDYGTPEGRARGELPFATFEKLLPWLREAHSINLNVVGEPLIYSRLADVLERLGPACERTHFNTNGVALTPALARELVHRRIGSLVVSIDGRESNAAVRGVPYELLRDRLALVAAEKRSQGATQPILGVAYTLMPRNRFELRPLIDELAPLGLQSVHVQPLMIFYEGLRTENIYACADVDALLQECAAHAATLGVELVVFRSQWIADERHQQELRLQLGPYSETYGCSDPFVEIKILHTGQVQACSRGLLTGFDVDRLSLDEIWNHPWYTNLRRRLYAKRFEDLCTHCPYQFGSQENQVMPIRLGVHHSHEERLTSSPQFPPRRPPASSFSIAARSDTGGKQAPSTQT